MGEKTREQWEFIAQEYYNLLKERRDMSTAAHIGYGKWLLATLVAINGGAIVTISNLGTNAGLVLAQSGIWFLIGLMSAIVAAFLAWLNFQFSEHAYSELAEPGMIFDAEDWPVGEMPHGKKITVTLWLAAIVGILSWLCIAGGALALFSALK